VSLLFKAHLREEIKAALTVPTRCCWWNLATHLRDLHITD